MIYSGDGTWKATKRMKREPTAAAAAAGHPTIGYAVLIISLALVYVSVCVRVLFWRATARKSRVKKVSPRGIPECLLLPNRQRPVGCDVDFPQGCYNTSDNSMKLMPMRWVEKNGELLKKKNRERSSLQNPEISFAQWDPVEMAGMRGFPGFVFFGFLFAIDFL